VFGRTSLTTQFNVSGMKVVSNQRGYDRGGSEQGLIGEEDQIFAFDAQNCIAI